MLPKFILFPACMLVGNVAHGTCFGKCYSTLGNAFQL